jgi:phage tail sheath protein FI
LPSGVHTITGVATSITAFIGRAPQGPVDSPTTIHNFTDYVRLFGGLSAMSPMSYAVQQFFLNGGSAALIVRVVNGAVAAQFTVPGSTPLKIKARNPGLWGNNLVLGVDYATSNPADNTLFNLTVFQKGLDPDNPASYTPVETHRNLSLNQASKRYVANVLPADPTMPSDSALIQADLIPPAATPIPHPTSTWSGSYGTVPPDQATPITDLNTVAQIHVTTPGTDGSAITDANVVPATPKSGLYALELADLFNLLCIPPLDFGVDPAVGTWQSAAAYCRTRRAILVLDPPSGWTTKANAVSGLSGLTGGLMSDAQNVALYFPRVRMADALQENRLSEFPPSGAVCGVMARTDTERGVWKAPAGLDAGLSGVQQLSVKLTDLENGDLNPLAVNCLRSFPVYGNVVWGARTVKGADALANEWKYLPVRRTALFIEESLYRGTQWVVFEPNDEPLWAQIRLNVGAFMQALFRKGAFQGKSSREAYLVKCDSETTTQTDIDLGVVNIVVGFAPLKPAEFVILQIQQLAGKIEV